MTVTEEDVLKMLSEKPRGLKYLRELCGEMSDYFVSSLVVNGDAELVGQTLYITEKGRKRLRAL
jgi:hypothetical protein